MAKDKKNILGGIESISKRDLDYLIDYTTGEKAQLNILNSHVFRYYMSPTGDFLDYPIPNNPEDVAKITVKKVTDYDDKSFKQSSINDLDTHYEINVNKIKITFDKINGTMVVHDNRTNKVVLKESNAMSYTDDECTQTLHQSDNEYFFGGGMQNGRFTHKGNCIRIVNTNNWINGGVTSPCPFYWSTYGYGILRNTWQPGAYDFGSKSPETVQTCHNESNFDAFFFINSQPKDILNDYYELTGQPIFMPEYAFYEAHLNAFNRDYWVKVASETQGAILFEDGHYYKSYQPNDIGDKKGILESLNGEKNNYQFSARAMIDRYKRHDMPLGWFIPNDGYGSGYGQTDSLDGDIHNLKEFADYSRENGVEVALWTESNLHPEDPLHPKKGERDLSKEISVAKVVALKCDVAWIGHGYSFGLNAVDDVTDIFVKNSNIRPFIITVDGWAGTQRYSGIWSGDQSGGQWEYIRFHIPTYIGTGLSGQPIVGSDMDGIYGGKIKEVNIRDYQWKTFTPLQLNMDGWGHIPKTPFSFDEEATEINRAYLKLKSMLLPYNYTVGYESIHGLPMVRAMFLEFPDDIAAYTKDSQYQFMWGPNILIAPIYKQGDLRDGVFLPDANQIWIDFFTGKKYRGGKILNNIAAPIWKIPIYVKDGSIIPMSNPNNNPEEIIRSNRIFLMYPNNESVFNVYEDDGISNDYLKGYFATTKIKVHGPKLNEHGDLSISIDKTNGTYEGIVKKRTTFLQIMATRDVDHIKVCINDEPLKISKASSYHEFQQGKNIYFFTNDFVINPYLQNYNNAVQNCLLIKIQSMDITSAKLHIKIKDYTNESAIFGGKLNICETLETPANFKVIGNEIPTSISLEWEPVEEALYYEIERDGILFTNIKGNTFKFQDFKYNSQHSFRIRSANNDNVSKWSNFLEANTLENPFKNVVKGVKVTCNIPCQPCQEVCKLTDGDLTSLWHTHWHKPVHRNNDKNIVKLYFDLGDIYDVEKMEYKPRDDAGNGTFLKIQYRFSSDGKNWSVLSDPIDLKCDASEKNIPMSGNKLRFLELHVLDSIGGFGSGKHFLFYKKILRY